MMRDTDGWQFLMSLYVHAVRRRIFSYGSGWQLLLSREAAAL